MRDRASGVHPDVLEDLPPIFATPWTIACHAPLSMEYFRQEYWNGLPLPSPMEFWNFPRSGIEPMSPALAGWILNPWTTREVQNSDF